MEDYFDAKASLFTPERAAPGLVCVDDEWGRRLARGGRHARSRRSARAADADWRIRVDGSDPAALPAHRTGGSTST